MSVKVAVNGFGRIGRIFYRICMGDPNIEIVAINDLADAYTLAHLLKFDSTHGTLPLDVEVSDKLIKVGDKEIKVFNESEPGKVDWAKEGVQIVVESTGKLAYREAAEKHLDAGAKLVLFSSTGSKIFRDPDIVLVYGVNHEKYTPLNNTGAHRIVSNASCTSNSIIPICDVLIRNFGIIRGQMSTVHAYTADQRLWDTWHKDLRRARAAAVSIIPTKTGAAKAIGLVLPELEGKMDAIAFRVPTLDVSVIYLVAELKKDTSKEEVNEVFRKASENAFKGIIQYVEKPLVSVDFIGNPHSTIIDAELTSVVDKRNVSIVAWYDNEWGFSVRLRDLIIYMARKNGWIEETNGEAELLSFAVISYRDWREKMQHAKVEPYTIRQWLINGGFEAIGFEYSLLKKIIENPEDYWISDEECDIHSEEEFSSLVRSYRQSLKNTG